MKPACRYLILLLSMYLLACHNPQKAEHSFYYWKTTFEEGNEGDTMLINSLGIQHFYIRYLDVDWSENLNMPVPVGQLGNIYYQVARPYISTNYTPVIFITNRTFQQISDAWCDTLAIRLKEKTDQITGELEKTMEDYATWSGNYSQSDSLRNVIRQQRKNRVNEIQIDCDWTAKTRDKYFLFLRRLKQQIPDKKISATIRLYPYKYHQQTGVPPVDKGLLMCYNLSDIKNTATRNSVFDVDELKKYLTIKDYPLPLDIALPVFGWQAWFRGNSFKGILYFQNNALENNTAVFKKTSGNTVQVLQDYVLSNNYLRQGDVLRNEFPDEEELTKAADLLRDEFPKAGRIAFYYWNTQNVNRYEKTIRKIYDNW